MSRSFFIFLSPPRERLPLKLSQNASRDTADLIRWFADELRRRIELDYVTIVLDDDAKTDKWTVIRSDECRFNWCHPSDAQDFVDLGKVRFSGSRGAMKECSPGVSLGSQSEPGLPTVASFAAF